jgi:Mrp family chromosome partitioning ATPase
MKSPRMENIWILTSGHIPSNPAELLESPEMGNLIKELRDKFDVILFDSPPVLPVTDAVLLASKVDGVILCYEVGRTSRDALARAKIQLESAGAKIVGLILNHTVPQSAAIYPYYYSYKYRYYEKGEKHDQPMQNKENAEILLKKEHKHDRTMHNKENTNYIILIITITLISLGVIFYIIYISNKVYST